MPVTYPDFSGATQPADSPSLPVWADAYSPPVSGGAAGGSPVIAAYTKIAGPDNCLFLTGSGFTAFTAFGQTTSGNAFTGECTILELTSTRATIALPASLPTNSLIILWPHNSNGYGLPVLINRTEAHSIQCLTTGTNYGLDDGTDTCEVIGHSLSNTGDSLGKSAVYIISTGGGSGQYVTTISVNPYLVTFSLPALSDGTYNVWLHDGHGGGYGWSLIPMVLNVTTAIGLRRNYSVYTNSSALAGGPSGSDDTTALLAAIADLNGRGSASSAAGTILFPAGTFYTNQTLTIAGSFGSNVRLKGTAPGTTLTTTAGFANKQILKMTGEIDGVNIVWNAASTLTDSSLVAQGIQGGNALSLRNMTLDTHLMAPQMTGGTSDTGVSPFGGGVNVSSSGRVNGFVAQNVTFNCGVGFFGRASWLLFESCTFNMGRDVNSGGPISIWLGNNIICRNSTFQHIDPVAYPNEGRMFFISQGTTDTIYFGDNVGTNLQDTSGDTNKGELIGCESNNSFFFGPVISATSNTVTISTSTSSYVGCQVCVQISGNGSEGLWNICTSQASGVLGLAWNWPVIPDSTCSVNVVDVVSRMYVYNNQISKADTGPTASCLTQYFGGALDCVTDSNTVSGTTYGHASQTVITNGRVMPVWWNVHQNNTFTGVKGWGLRAWGNTTNPNGETAGFIGGIYRSLNLTMTAATFSGTQSHINLIGNGTVVDGIVFEHINSTDAACGISFNTADAAPTTVHLYKSSIRLGAATFAGSTSISPTNKANYRIHQVPGDLSVTTPGDVSAVTPGDIRVTTAGDKVYFGGQQLTGFAV